MNFHVGDTVEGVIGNSISIDEVQSGVVKSMDEDWLYLESGYCIMKSRAMLRVDMSEDVVNHPSHYTSHPSGVECVQVTEHMGFLIGNAVKYLWRCDLKKDAIEDLKKARWYIDREIAKREAQ